MPHINRIRVNNVKYNFGTQYYDDFHMGFYGKNTIYDLANGGGKSVLMLLLLQNLIPNCTLDEKQPIEKLFRSGNGNTTIHSMIEWKLSDAHIKNNYKYMLTGFCARKAKDTSLDEEVLEVSDTENASIEYFNYCIFYREFNDNDIKNFPLIKDNERMSYNNLKAYLKELAKKDYSLEIKIFERKGEYQRFISQYGLYESEWEIIRGINKTEGHVRTYFETNYKTTRKVVEDLLIEEIIQKSFNNKTQVTGEEDYMATTLLNIKDKLVELSGKKEDISGYTRQIEVLENFMSRLVPLKQMYFGKEKLDDEIAKSVNSLKRDLNECDALITELSDEVKAYEAKKNVIRFEVEAAKIIKLTNEEEKILKRINELEVEKDKKIADMEALLDKLKIYESINNYDDYLYYKNERDTVKNVIENALKDKGEVIDELKKLAGAKKVFDEKKILDINEKLAEQREILEKEKEVVSSSEERIAELEKELAVNAYLIKDYENRENKLNEDIKQRLEETGVYFTTNVSEELKKAGALKEDTTEKYNRAVKEYEDIQIAIRETKDDLIVKTKLLDSIDEKIMELSDKKTMQMDIIEKFERICQVYDEKDIGDLISLLKIKLDEVSDELTDCKNLLLSKAAYKKYLENGCPVGNSTELQKVLDYIERYYGKIATPGSHYMTTLTREEKEDVLERIPFLPYSIVVKDRYDEVVSDSKLKELEIGNYTVPIVKANVVLGIERVVDYANVSFVMFKNELFIDEFARDKEIGKQRNEMDNLEHKVLRLTEVKNVYEEDLAFVREYQSLWQTEIKNTNEYYEDYRNRRKEADTECEAMAKSVEEMKKNVVIAEELCKNLDMDLYNITSRFDSLNELSQIMTEENKISYDLGVANEKYEKMSKECISIKARVEATKDSISERERQIGGFVKQQDDINDEWNKYYKMYYSPASATEAEIFTQTMDEGSVATKFKGLLKVVDSENIDMDDKKKLMENYEVAMEKSLQAIDYKGVSLDFVKEQYEKSPIKNVDTKELIGMRNQADEMNGKIKEITGEQNRLNSVRDKNLGAIENAKEAIKEKYGNPDEISIHFDDYNEFVQVRKNMIMELDNQMQGMVQKSENAKKKYSNLLLLDRDMDKIIKTGNIVNNDKENCFESFVNIEEKVENVLLEVERFNREVAGKKDDFIKSKDILIDMLKKLGSDVLAEDIRANVAMPTDLSETSELIDSLSDVVKCIDIERDRVLKSIEDMEKIKDNFENQCIQTCINIKNELDRLPKLSKIYMDDEAISIIGLTIPYVNEEQYKNRMSEYIDEIVSAVDNIKVETERVKYIRNQLAWKKMFSVIVTDMNRIKLNLYKRERIKEQSRYLKYEEAVGSTGQSQGIYIQFLIAIINYISSINSRNSDGTSLGKVIFIDNPFGAAKDVYIWEPIFKLLKTNNVQMVVPARGATPAITGRFDVNYILGQKLIDGKQQTVVVDYFSNVDSSKLDYSKMEFTQATWF
ncbi:MAG: hypothetical protein J6L69_04365 [Lachnospiraceae bacterium]|nr:hypothetical protein [Lachnospiraceae bacterium]